MGRFVPGLAGILVVAAVDPASGASLRFFGAGVAAPTLDRVAIPLDVPARPVDVGATDTTVEFWMKALPGDNGSSFVCHPGADAWIFGNILLDRDVFGDGDFGDWGISLASGRLAYGAGVGTAGATACGVTAVADGLWHHVAATRRESDGLLQLWVDGTLDGSADGPEGDLSYRDGRSTPFPYDPYLVLGAEKHDAGASFPSYRGWLDELRISTARRYTAAFSPPAAPFASDGSTAALYHFDEAEGTVLGDVSGAAGGPSDGQLRVGGDPPGPAWSADSPFSPLLFADGFETGDTSAWSATVP